MRRVLALSLVLLLALVAPAAAQDTDGNPFNDGLPSPTPTVTAAPSNTGDDASSATIWIIAGGVLVAFVGIGWFITRDARRNLTAEDRRAVERGFDAPARDDERLAGGARGRAKTKARKKGKAQRRARKANRPR